MKKIGIICASDTELEPFLLHIQFSKTQEKGMLKFYIGNLKGLEVIAVYSGVCKVNSAIATQIMIDTFQVDAIINSGVAGGMAENINLFDTVISKKMIYHDMAEDILTEYHPWLKENHFKGDKILLSFAKKYSKKTNFPILFGVTVTGEQFIEDEKRFEINKLFSPLSVDMETTSIAHVCYVNKIPFLSVRTITDTAKHKGIENFEKNCEMASKIASEIVLGILDEIN